MVQKRKRLLLRFPVTTNVLTKLFLGVFLINVYVSSAFGQSLEDLKVEQAYLNKKLDLASKLLSENQHKKGDTESKISLLSKQVETRRKLLYSIEKEVISIKSRQITSDQEIRKLQKQKQDLIGSYSTVLQTSYRSKLLKNRWLFLFSSQSLPQLYRRWRYLKLLNNGVGKQFGSINLTVEKIDQELTKLKQLESDKEKALKENELQKKTLDQNLISHQNALSSLKKEEKNLKADIQEKRKSQAKLREAIVKVISESRGESNNLPLTPAMAKLSNSFAANKGNFPWPVERGLIVRNFGKQIHPTLKNVTVVNNGVDITTDAGSTVKAIFEGTIVGQQYIPGYDHMLIVSHGDYYTVYSYLSVTLVRKGEKIKTGDSIGIARERGGTGQIHLEIWQGRELLNPQSWLKDH